MFDYLIVGAGFAGSVLAERLATQLGKRVLLCDKRPHIGGNAYDHFDDAGVLVHKYGPHVFHTSAPRVFRYLSRFTKWRSYEHRVLAAVGGELVPSPSFADDFQAMPLHGYTRLFENMLDNEHITIVLNTDYRDLIDEVRFRPR